MKRLFFLLTGIATVSPTAAHHSPTAFEMSQVVAFEGTVTQFDWRNPHVYLTIDDSNNARWLIETDATPVMIRSDWTRDSFVPGDRVTVWAHPNRDSNKTNGLLLSIPRSDGATMTSLNRVSRSGPIHPRAATTNLAGIWQAKLLPATNPITVPILGALAGHPLTEKGAAAKAAYDETITPAANCIAFPSPLVVALTALYLGEFELQDDVIIFRSEFFNAERTIYLDGRRHPENGERTIQGHSIGEWEDDTLVVDTTLFSEHRSPYGIGIPSGTQKHVIERYTLSDDGTQLLVDIALEDPEYLAERFSGSLALNYSPHLEMLSIECDPEVARRFIL